MRDIKNIDLNLLKALDALLDERSVTRAAARLSLTQPAMSGMLTRLRDSFGDPLFVRAQRGVVPTDRALALAMPVKQVLADIHALLQPADFDPASSTMTLALAATDYALQAIAVPFLSALKREAPHIRVAVLPIEDDKVQTQLERGELDLALMTPVSAPADLHSRRLFDERYVCVLRDGHPALADAPLTLDAFCALDHALISYQGGGFRGVTDEALARLGRQRQVTLSVKSFMVLPDILRATDLIAVVPERLVNLACGLQRITPPLEIPGFTKIAVWHARTHQEPGHRWLRERLFATCQTASSI